jgi:hypothetical protein
MSSTQDEIRAIGRALASLFVLAVMALSPAAFAEPTDLKDLVSKPQAYLGQEVEIEGYCVKNGRSGDVLGYECTTKEGVYVDADDIEPEAAKEKLAGSCAGGSCVATIRFTPHSYTTSAVIEPDKDVVVFNADKAQVSF